MATSTNPLLQTPFLKYKQASTSIALAGTDCGSCIVNDSATASITVALPLAKAGTWFRFYVNAPFTIVIQPKASDRIGQQSGGVSYTLAAIIGTDLTLTCIGDGIWAMGSGNQLYPPVVIPGIPDSIASTLTIGGNSVAGQLTVVINNPNTADATDARLVINGGATSLSIFSFPAATSTAVIPGGPTGAAVVLQTLGASGAQPLIFGTGNHINMMLTGTLANAAITGWGPTAAAMVDMTPDTGTFTITYTGTVGPVTGTAKWAKMGNIIILGLPPSTSGASNSTSFTATGLPAAISPANQVNFFVPDCVDAGVGTPCAGAIAAAGTVITLSKGFIATPASWTASGSKGINNNSYAMCTYFLN